MFKKKLFEILGQLNKPIKYCMQFLCGLIDEMAFMLKSGRYWRFVLFWCVLAQFYSFFTYLPGTNVDSKSYVLTIMFQKNDKELIVKEIRPDSKSVIYNKPVDFSQKQSVLGIPVGINHYNCFT